jgi:sec-independent protein translocase protein TatA
MLPFAVIGTTEWFLILAVVLLLFGARKLPELARSLGSSVNEFKKGMADGAKDDGKSTTEVRANPPAGNGKSNNN